MTTDTKATYYDLALEATTSDGTRVAATIETRDIVRAVLERAGLGADASHQLGKVLERAIRLGAKPGTDVGREAEKIHIEAGMLRDAVGGTTVDAPMSDAERAAVWRRDALHRHAEAQRLDAELVAARARIAELERERDEARNLARRFQSAMDEEITRNADARATLETERKASIATAEELERVRAELAGVVDEGQLQRWRTALSASPTETLTNAICRVTSELAALRDRYRPRRQSEEPAPAGVPVLSWSHSEKRRDIGVWFWRMGENVAPNGTWTHQPPAPEAEREGE